jgi:serine/threonine protein kinase
MDDIKLVKKLGEGSYAVVYEATDAGGQRFAVKELKDAPSR